VSVLTSISQIVAVTYRKELWPAISTCLTSGSPHVHYGLHFDRRQWKSSEFSRLRLTYIRPGWNKWGVKIYFSVQI